MKKLNLKLVLVITIILSACNGFNQVSNTKKDIDNIKNLIINNKPKQNIDKEIKKHERSLNSQIKSINNLLASLTKQYNPHAKKNDIKNNLYYNQTTQLTKQVILLNEELEELNNIKQEFEHPDIYFMPNINKKMKQKHLKIKDEKRKFTQNQNEINKFLEAKKQKYDNNNNHKNQESDNKRILKITNNEDSKNTKEDKTEEQQVNKSDDIKSEFNEEAMKALKNSGLGTPNGLKLNLKQKICNGITFICSKIKKACINISKSFNKKIINPIKQAYHNNIKFNKSSNNNLEPSDHEENINICKDYNIDWIDNKEYYSAVI